MKPFFFVKPFFLVFLVKGCIMSVIGLDVGTEKSCIAVAQKGGIDILCNEVSNRTTP